jgi:hypothetical protein
MDTRRFRPHQVLGDAAQYQQALEQQQAAREAQHAEAGFAVKPKGSNEVLQEGLASLEPEVVDSIPEDVWAAAQLLGDQKGMRLIHIYKELAEQR